MCVYLFIVKVQNICHLVGSEEYNISHIVLLTSIPYSFKKKKTSKFNFCCAKNRNF